MKISALPGKLLVDEIKKGQRMVGRIILPNDDGKSTGVRSRWCKVLSVGEGVRNIKEDEWVLVTHGNWTRGITVQLHNEKKEMWSINYPDGVLAVTDNPSGFETWHGEQIIKSEPLER